jgi:hypothetical protein
VLHYIITTKHGDNMSKLHAFINKGDLILVTHRDKEVFDGTVGMIAKQDIESKASAYGSSVGQPQGDGDCIIFDMDDFEPLGNFYSLTSTPTSYNERIAVDRCELVIPTGCDWIVENIRLSW